MTSEAFIFFSQEVFKDGSEDKLARPDDISACGLSGLSSLLWTELSDFDRCSFLKDNLCLEACNMPS